MEVSKRRNLDLRAEPHLCSSRTGFSRPPSQPRGLYQVSKEAGIFDELPWVLLSLITPPSVCFWGVRR